VEGQAVAIGYIFPDLLSRHPHNNEELTCNPAFRDLNALPWFAGTRTLPAVSLRPSDEEPVFPSEFMKRAGRENSNGKNFVKAYEPSVAIAIYSWVCGFIEGKDE
jgi:hypothetical protein